MRRHKHFFVVPAVLAAVVSVASAQQRVELLPAAAGDLVATDLVTPLAAKAAPAVSHEPVTASWPLDRQQAVDLEVAPFAAHSREYWVEVTADELGRGIPVYAESPAALVRLNPAPAAAGKPPAALLDNAIDPLGLVVVDAAGRAWTAGSAMEQLVSPEQMAQADVAFPAGTSAFRLRPELGAGPFELRAEGLSGDGRYVVHVFDAGSAVELTLGTARASYLHGQTLELEASFVRGERRLPLQEIDGFVTSPAGRAWPVAFELVRAGVYRAALELDGLEPLAPGLWEAHVAAHGRVAGQPVLRNARTAFACAVPSARLNGDVTLETGDPLKVRLGLEVAAAGRYGVRGVVFGTAPDGALVPAGVTQSAAWLEAGTGALELELSRDVLAAGGLAAPFEVRDLRLDDQGRMGVLHRQARGLVIE